MRNKMKYKMRAECSADVARFLVNVVVVSIRAKRIRIKGLIRPDMEVSFESTLNLEEIKALIVNIVDGHVMLETVALEKDYTGERK